MASSGFIWSNGSFPPFLMPSLQPMLGNTDSFQVFLSSRKGEGNIWQLPQYCFASFSPLVGSISGMDIPETRAKNSPASKTTMNMLKYVCLIDLTFSKVRIIERPPLNRLMGNCLSIISRSPLSLFKPGHGMTQQDFFSFCANDCAV